MKRRVTFKGKLRRKEPNEGKEGVRVKPRPRAWDLRRGDVRTPLIDGDAEIDIHVRSPGGPCKIVSMKPADFVKPARAADLILNATGCTEQRGKLEAELAKLPSLPPARAIHTTHRSGPSHDLFVTPRAVIRLLEGASRSVVFDQGRAQRNEALGGLGAKSGTLKGWRTRVAPQVAYSTIGMTAVAAALSPHLLELSGLSEAFLIILAGPSSGGKSVITLAAMSVQGEATRARMVPPGLTERALEEVGQGYNSLLLPFDDLGRITDPGTVRKTVRWLTYQFSDGGGRLVSDTALRQGLTFERFKSVGLISSERSSAEIAKLAGDTRQAGESARMFDLVADADIGVFDQLPEQETRTPEAIAKELEAMVKEEYGTPLRALLAWLRQREPAGLQSRLNELIKHFVEHAAAGGDNVQRRAADKFGLMYAALMLGRDAKIIPWSAAECLAALMKTYRRAMSDPNRVAPAAALIERLKTTLRQPGRTLQADARGRVKDEFDDRWLAVRGLRFKGVPVLGIREAVLRSCFPNAVEYERLIAEMVAIGWMTLSTGKDRWQPRLRHGAVISKPRLMRVSVQLTVNTASPNACASGELYET